MKRNAIKSSNIAAIGWDDDVLEVQFANAKIAGPVWRYYGVPKTVFDEMHKLGQDGAGAGGYFFRNIRSTYKARKRPDRKADAKGAADAR